jgi:hypothetical protein
MSIPQLNTIAGVNYDILAYSDVTFNIQLTFTDGAGNPISKAGAVFLFTIRETLKSSSPIALQLTSGAGQITVGGTSNNIVTINADLLITGGTYYYELQETDVSGFSLVPIYGRIFINKSVTTP